jgi:hypothetical protein
VHRALTGSTDLAADWAEELMVLLTAPWPTICGGAWPSGCWR